jgi:hypothetical protein
MKQLCFLLVIMLPTFPTIHIFIKNNIRFNDISCKIYVWRIFKCKVMPYFTIKLNTFICLFKWFTLVKQCISVGLNVS